MTWNNFPLNQLIGLLCYILAMQPKNEPDGQKGRSFIEEARRTQIVAAAIETIAEAGYPRASMERIASKAGISRGLISYHFAGKAELIREVATMIYMDGATFMGPRIEAETRPPAQLRAYITANLEYMRAHPERMVALVEIFTAAGTAVSSAPDTEASAVEDGTLAPLVGIFHTGQANGDFGDFDPKVMARLVRAAIDTVPPQLSRDPDRDRVIDVNIAEITKVFDRATRALDPKEHQ